MACPLRSFLKGEVLDTSRLKTVSIDYPVCEKTFAIIKLVALDKTGSNKTL